MFFIPLIAGSHRKCGHLIKRCFVTQNRWTWIRILWGFQICNQIICNHFHSKLLAILWRTVIWLTLNEHGPKFYDDYLLLDNCYAMTILTPCYDPIRTECLHRQETIFLIIPVYIFYSGFPHEGKWDKHDDGLIASVSICMWS